MSIIGLGNQVLVCRPSLQKLSNQKAIMINVWEELLLTFNFFCTILEDTADCEKVSSLIPRQGGLLQDINFSSEINYKCIRQPHKNDLKSKKKYLKIFACKQSGTVKIRALPYIYLQLSVTVIMYLYRYLLPTYFQACKYRQVDYII